MTDEADSRGILRDLRPLPPELEFIKEDQHARLASTDVDDFYGALETSPFIRIFHGTRDFKLHMIAEEGLKGFEEHKGWDPKVYVTVDPVLAARHAFYQGPHDTQRHRGSISEESVTGDPVVLMIQVDKAWLRASPDSQKPLDIPFLVSINPTELNENKRITAFETLLRRDVKLLKRGDELSDFGIAFPTDQIPPRFVYVVRPEGNIPIDQYSVIPSQAVA
ncbi:MAG: hypothetical protein HY426_05020 [Candidatus Levybacteria bacterium]|nr:hypothetical protein [Candidatus Levybacteria bacterium]